MLSKKTTSIIITILSLIIISAMVYGAAKKQESDSEKYKGWTLYENKEAGFSLKYPASFVVYEDKINHPGENEYPKEIIFASKPRPERPDCNLDFYTGEYAVIIRSGKNALSLTLEEWVKENAYFITLEDLEKQKKDREIQIAGHKALIVKTWGGELDVIEAFLVTKNKYFLITLIPFLSEELLPKYPTHKDSVKNLHLMLESFKLLKESE
ncbi:MAG: hypothetical protein ABIG90_03770 [bacterium]